MIIKKIVSKFGVRGAHICLPKHLIGKEVQIIAEEPECEYIKRKEVEDLIEAKLRPVKDES